MIHTFLKSTLTFYKVSDLFTHRAYVCLKYMHRTVMSGYGLRHILRYKWKTKLIHSSQNFGRKTTVALSALLNEQLKNAYKDLHLFVLPWVTDLDKLSFC